MKNIYLCAISNVSSGNCSEDCAFCTQSSFNKVEIKKYKQKDIDVILKEAKMAKQNQASGFCLVTSGKGLDDKKLDFICKVAKKIKKEIDIHLIACNGTASLEQLQELKKYGIESYNHNLETSKNYYPKICTTHSWEERYKTCLNIKKSGLNLCSGGIFGLGESDEDRISFIESIVELSPVTIPVNFFHPNEKLPLENKIFNAKEGLKWIKYLHQKATKSVIMIAGGREITFKDKWTDTLKAGANSIVIGNYLTTKGNNSLDDIEKLKKEGYTIAEHCSH